MKKYLCLLFALLISITLAARTPVYKSISMFDFSQVKDNAEDMVIATLGGLGTTVIEYDEALKNYVLTVNVGKDPFLGTRLTDPCVVSDKKITFKASVGGEQLTVTVAPKKIDIGDFLTVDLMEEDNFPQLMSFIKAKSVASVSTSARRPRSIPRDLDLAIRRNGKTYYVNTAEWSNLPGKNAYQIVGIALLRGGHKFIVAWNDEYENVQYTDWQSALNRYGTKIPTKQQADIIQNCTNLRDVARAYGTDNYGNWYWTRTSCPAPQTDCAYIFCPGIPDVAYDRAEKDNSNGILLVYPLN